MAFLQRLAERIGNDRFFKVMRLYPPYLGAGVVVRRVARDLTSLEVEMKLTPLNQNFVGTHFGGSLYSMCDPWFMLLLMMQIGDGYVVWDKSASIDFLKPGRGTVRALFEMPREKVEDLQRETQAKGKINPVFQAEVKGAGGEVVARVTKVLSVRMKERNGAPPPSV
jgi:acyl-coenzyme A thioesterase PaaI-like protein